IWVSSNRGVARLDPDTRTTRSFTPRDGLQGYEYNRGAALIDASNHLYFGGTAGFNRFFPDDIRDNPIPPPVSLTRFFLFGEEQQPRDDQGILERQVSYQPFVELQHRQNVVSLQFAALHFVAPERNQYRYRLDGFDRDWTAVAADNRVATYTNLDPGTYRFRVQGANSDGVWSTDEATLDMVVLAPWWERPAALLAYVVLGILALTAFVRWRTLSLRAQAAELQRTVDERTELVTRQKETIEEQAGKTAELLHAKEQLFARVSHEFRTPLTLILGAADRLSPETGDTTFRQRTASIKSSGERLLRLVNQLLDIARTDESGVEDAVPQDFSAIVRAALDGFEGLAKTRGITLEAHVDDSTCVLAPPASLEPLILNLLSNALKFTPSDGKVMVRLETASGETRLSVEDTGPGIPEELKPALFEPFTRGTDPASGSGIGLALVNETAVALGGSVSADNRAQGGAEFVVTLPVTALLPAATADAVIPDVTAEVSYAERALRPVVPTVQPEGAFTDGAADVLIVEDEAELRGFLVETIGERYRVRAESDGAAALAAIRENAPDIVVSDVMMPAMDGFELLRAIKTDERTSHVPVVLLTAHGDSSNLMRGLEEGADEYLTKPFNADELMLRLRNLLETRRMLQLRIARKLAGETTEDEPAVVGLGKRDQAFLERLDALLERRYADTGVAVGDLATELAMSDRQLQRKLKSLTNLSPSEYLRAYRLRKAAALLADGGSAGEVAFATGFNSQSHFGACFKAYFGCTPGEYRESVS
ncbi:MAG: response regulator, partial [Pseudomonadota bacterium]